MTKEEYKEKKNELLKEYENNLRNLDKLYVQEQLNVKIGDIVTDHIGKGRVEKITYYRGFSDYPEYICHCVVLNKDNSERKKGETERKIYQSNIKEINGLKVNKD